MKKVVTDASIWVSRLVPEDAFHEQVKNWLATLREAETEFLAPSILLAEIGGAISRRTGKPSLGHRAVKHITNLPALRIIDMDRSLAEAAAELAAELGVRGADSFYIAAAAHLSVPLVTLDVDQKNRASLRVDILDIP